MCVSLSPHPTPFILLFFSRIFQAHAQHRGTTDIFSLHRLYLQYCRQWIYYGVVAFPCQLVRYKRGGIRLAKSDPVLLGLNREWLTLAASQDMDSLLAVAWDEVCRSS